MLSKSEIKTAIEKAPAVAAAVKKLASKVARGVRLPETYSVKGLDYDAQRELEHLLGIIGTVKVFVPLPLILNLYSHSPQESY